MSIEQIEKEEVFCSVVLPVHNGERFLREAIESVLNQTYTNFEFIIIENCSTDLSLKILKSYSDNRIKIIIENNCGQVQAYNRGLKESKGEYIFIHDQDDISDTRRFKEQLKFMQTNSVDICGSYFSLINQNNETIGQIEMPTAHTNIVDMLLYKNSVIFNSSVCLRKYVFEMLGDFDINYYPSADYDFYLKGILKFVYGNVPVHLYYWRQHSQQISSTFIKDIREKTISISLKNRNHFPNRMLYTYMGLVYYYNNKLFEAFRLFLFAILRDKLSKKLVRYFSIVLFAGVPLTIFRKYNLVNSVIFLFAKRIIDKIIK